MHRSVAGNREKQMARLMNISSHVRSLACLKGNMKQQGREKRAV